MSKRGTGISAEELIKLETIKRANEFRVAVIEMIKVNNQLEKATLKQAKKRGTSTKKFKKSSNEIIALEKKQASIWRAMNKEAKKNTQIYKAKTKSNIELKKSIAGINIELRKQEMSLDRLNKTTKKSSSMFSKFNPTRMVAGIGLAVAGFSSLVNEVKSTITLLKKIESLKFTMSNIIKDPEDLDRTMGRLIKLSNDYGVEIVSLTERYSNFLVAADQSGISLKDTEEIFGTVTKAMSLMGKSTDETKGSLLAIEQMMSKGKITTEELRRQLGERLPGAMGIMADAVGVNIDELDKMMKKGEVISAEVLPAFAREIERVFGTDQVDRMETFIAAQNRSTNAWTLMWEAIESGEGAVGKALKWGERMKTAMYKAMTPYNEVITRRTFMAEGYDFAETDSQLNAVEALKKKGIQEASQLEIIKEEEELAVDALARAKREEAKSAKRLNDAKVEISDLEDDILDAKKEMAGLKVDEKFESELRRLGKVVRDANSKIKEEKIKNKRLVTLNAIDIGYRQFYEDLVEKVEGVTGTGGKGGDKKKAKKAIQILKEKELHLSKYSKTLISIMQKELQFFNKQYNSAEKEEDIEEWIVRIHKQEMAIAKLRKDKSIDDLLVKREKATDRIDAKIDSINRKIKKNESINTPDARKQIENGKESIKTLQSNQGKIIIEWINEVGRLNKKYRLETSEIHNNELQNRLNSFKKYVNDEFEIRKSKSNAQRDEELKNLEYAYSEKLISEEKYQEKKAEIENKYLIESANKELEKFLKLKDHYLKIANDDSLEIKVSQVEVEKVLAKIKELEKILAELENKKVKIDFTEVMGKIEKFVDTYKDAFMDMTDSMHEHAISIHEAKIELLEEEKDAMQEMYDHHKELALDDAEQKRLIMREEEARRKMYDKKIAKEKNAMAKKERDYALFQIAISTASAIIGFLAMKPVTPANIILSAMALTTGLFQTATVKSQKLPKYKQGTPKGGHKEDGFAEVGDGGVAEVVESSLGTYLTPATSTVTYLRKGDIVHKNTNEYYKSQIRKQLAPIGGSKVAPHLLEYDQNRLNSAIIKALSNANITLNNNITLDDYNTYKRLKNDI